LPQDSEFFKNFDLDKSGGFSFDEWLLFQSLLSIPAEDVAVAFSIIDSDGNGSIDANEFQSLLDSVQARAKVRPTATLRRSAADPTTGHAGLVTGFFGADRSKTLTLPQLQEFIDQLRVELMRLEFDFYDWKQRGAIIGRDFAHSVVCWARLKHVDGYLDKVDALPPSLANADVTFDEFKQFRGCLRRLRAIEVALEFWRASTGHVTSKDFETVTARVLGKALPRHVLEVLHHLFGARDGELNTDYLVTVMERHHETGGTASAWASEAGKDGGKSQGGWVGCMVKCMAHR
jgi:calcium uptake protein 1, mitochondrial